MAGGKDRVRLTDEGTRNAGCADGNEEGHAGSAHTHLNRGREINLNFRGIHPPADSLNRPGKQPLMAPWSGACHCAELGTISLLCPLPGGGASLLHRRDSTAEVARREVTGPGDPDGRTG